MHVATAAVRASLRKPDKLLWLPLRVVLDRCDRSRLSEPKSDRSLLPPPLPPVVAFGGAAAVSPLLLPWEREVIVLLVVDSVRVAVRPKSDAEWLLHIFDLEGVVVLIFCLAGERIIAWLADRSDEKINDE